MTNTRKIFIGHIISLVMDLDLGSVRFSYRDKEKGIKIPKVLTPELAEDIGIHIGDGSLYRCNHKKTAYEFNYSSNINERDYLYYIIDLKKKLYNLQKFRVVNKKGIELNFIFNSLAIATFYENVLKIPVGSKVYIAKIPNIIKKSNNKKIIASCIRGIVDTDFCFCFLNRNGKLYPRLMATFASYNLVKDLEEAFDLLSIKNNVNFYVAKKDKRFNKFYIGHIITINGYKRISRYIKLVGFSNPKNIKKLEVGPKRFEFEEHY